MYKYIHLKSIKQKIQQCIKKTMYHDQIEIKECSHFIF